jgi:hypothetical protein
MASSLIVGSLAVCLFFACGDKQNPRGDVPSDGGSTGTGAGGVTGTGGSTENSPIDGSSIDADDSIDGGGAGGATSVPDAAPTASVSYALQIAPLVQKSCSCHVSLGTAPPLNNYANTKANASASNSAIAAGTMPPGSPLSAADKALFQAWIAAGTPNN